MSNVHDYPVRVSWTGGRGGSGTVVATRSETQNALAVPPEFQGTGTGTNPEELLTTAIASCYSITFGIIAENRKLPVTSIETQATGHVAQNGANFVYTDIVIRTAWKRSS